MGIEQFLWFIFVFISIIVMAYYLSRYYASFTLSANKTRYIKVVDKYVIGRDKFILLIKIDKKFYLIGITNNDIRLISDIDNLNNYTETNDVLINPQPNKLMESFKEILNKQNARNRKGK